MICMSQLHTFCLPHVSCLDVTLMERDDRSLLASSYAWRKTWLGGYISLRFGTAAAQKFQEPMTNQTFIVFG